MRVISAGATQHGSVHRGYFQIPALKHRLRHLLDDDFIDAEKTARAEREVQAGKDDGKKDGGAILHKQLLVAEFPNPDIAETDRFAGIAVSLELDRRPIELLVNRLADEDRLAL